MSIEPKIVVKIPPNIDEAFDTSKAEEEILKLAKSLWIVRKGESYDLTIAVAYRHHEYMIDISDKNSHDKFSVPEGKVVGESIGELLNSFIYRLLNLHKYNWTAPPKLPESDWMKDDQYYKLLVDGQRHPKNPGWEKVDVIMKSKVLPGLDQTSRTKSYYAVMRIKDKHTGVIIGGERRTKEDAPEALYEDMQETKLKTRLDADLIMKSVSNSYSK